MLSPTFWGHLKLREFFISIITAIIIEIIDPIIAPRAGENIIMDIIVISKV